MLVRTKQPSSVAVPSADATVVVAAGVVVVVVVVVASVVVAGTKSAGTQGRQT